MAANESALFSVICQCKDINKTAQEYCPQCEEALCDDCRDNHKISRLSKSHQTIPIDKYNKLPSFIKQISHNCEEHGFVLEFFCKYHDALCCKRCVISGHKECKEIIFTEDVLTSSSGHQSAALDSIANFLKDLELNISIAIKDRNRNLTELREQKRVIGEQINEKREEINTMFNNLEKALIEKVSAVEKKICRKIENVITKLEDEKKNVDEIIKDVDFVKMFASNLQIFMGTKIFQKNVSTNELNVQSLYDNGSFSSLTMVYTLNEKLKGLMTEIKSFGDIEVTKCEKHALFLLKVEKSAQIIKPMLKIKPIENINARLVRKINIDCRFISGCAMSEAGDIFFLQSHENNLMKYKPNGEFHFKSCIISGKCKFGYDLAVVDSETIAVSSGGYDKPQICLIDITSTHTRHVFQLSNFCYGLSLINESFIYSTYNDGIKIFDGSNQNLTNVRILPNAPQDVKFNYITSNENNIFHSYCDDNSVVCYDYNGQVQWKYAESILRQPCGIALDTYSNIYVAGCQSNNIVVISPDGKQAKELIGSCDGISNPRTVFFHKTKHLLLVANYCDAAYVYDVI